MKRVPAARLVGERYRLEQRIGRGGHAEVWRAHDERLDRSVSVKLLHPHLFADATSQARMRDEAHATAGLAHPGIVPVYDVVDDDESIAIVFQHVPGESLAERLAQGGVLPAEDVRRIALEVASALDHAHRAGLLHLDVKPGNVVLDDEGRARLVDFGIARLMADAELRSAQDGKVTGSLRHMAPEQLSGGPLDARTDLYALGVLMVELLAGHPPFDGASPAELVAAERSGAPNLTSVPDDLRSLVARLLDADPTNRPASAREVVDELQPEGPAWITGIAPIGLGTGTMLDDPTVQLAYNSTRTFDAAQAVPVPVTVPAPKPAPAAARATSAPPSKPRARLSGGQPSARTSPRIPGVAAGVVLAVVVGALIIGGGLGGKVGANQPSADASVVAIPSPVATPEPKDPGKGNGKGNGNGGKGNGN